jgi:uncharacterized protein (DUF305 family)
MSMLFTIGGIQMKISKIAFAALAVVTLSANAVPQHEAGAHGGMAQGAAAPHDMKKMHSMHMSSPNASKAPYEQQFLDTMAMHHQMALHMAGLVESRAAHQDLKEMAKKMISDQEKEIAQLKGWKEQWYPGKPEAMNMKMPGMAESMKGMSHEKLTAAKGEAFDLMFIDMMTQHHKGAIKMAKAAAPKLKHAEAKEFAKNVVAMQTKEIAHMAEMKKSWAGVKK